MSVTPYTYIIGWKALGAFYYGVRYANRTAPKEDLWVRYFTSSKVVAEFRKIHGEPDVIIVHRTFPDSPTALAFERETLSRVRADESPHWLNACISPEKFQPTSLTVRTRVKLSEMAKIREKTKGDPEGRKAARASKRKEWKKASHKSYWQTSAAEGHKNTITAIHSGKDVSLETRKKISDKTADKTKARNTNVYTCPHCGKQGKGDAFRFRWHFDKCRDM